MPGYFAGAFPPSLERLLRNCPKTGSGTRAVSHYLLELANHLRHYAEIDEARKLLREATRDCGRRVSVDENQPGTAKGLWDKFGNARTGAPPALFARRQFD